MSARDTLTAEQRAALRKLLGDVKPARADLLHRLGEAVRDCREHQHDASEDLFCGNLHGWLGERMAPVLRRLLDAEAEVARLRADRTEVLTEAADLFDSYGRAQLDGGIMTATEVAEKLREHAVSAAPAGSEPAAPTPLPVRWDRLVIHPCDRGGETIVCCIADDGRPVALQLDDEYREALGGQLLDPDGDGGELTVYRASHESIVMGLYTTREAAREHCESLTRRECGDAVTLGWIPDDGSDDAPEELSVFGPGWDDDGPEETCTGYVVTPLTVASAYDEDGDE